jgi:hypothetical protein
MFAKLNSNILGCLLLALLLITRASHFGTSALLPDASIACFFLLGAYSAKARWFVLALILAVAIDLVVTRLMIVSDYCMSPGYWGLILVYGMVWMIGRRLNGKEDIKLTSLIIYGGLASTLAFILSNAFWYAFSDKVANMSLANFSHAVSQYFVPYLGFSLFYIFAMWICIYLVNYFRQYLFSFKSSH